MVDKILARLKKLGQQFLVWWGKFAKKQKVIIVSVLFGVVAALTILIVVLSQSKYTYLITAENSSEGAEVRDILSDAGVDYKVSDNGCVFSVEKSQVSKANLALGSSGYETDTYADLKSAISGGFSTTESDKQKYYMKYMEAQLESDIRFFSYVRDVTVNLDIKADNGTLISNGQEASAAIILDLRDKFTSDMAESMARFVATALGNKGTENITIQDTEGHLYFSGIDASTAAGTANSLIAVRQQISDMTKAEVTSVLLGIGEFGDIQIALNLDVDLSTTEKTKHDYSVDDGRTEGYLSEKNLYEAESTSGDGGVPGTTNNTDDTSYVIGENSESSSTETELSEKYLLDEEVTYMTIPAGAKINGADSTISVSATIFKQIKEEDAKKLGLLEGTTWTEYKLNNKDRVKIEVDQDWVKAVEKATGVPEGNIAFLVYRQNMFVDAKGFSVKATDVITVVLILLILGLLAFVVIRSMRSVKHQEREEELSVENLLQSNPEPALEGIEMEEKSNARKIIEKFVDDNPDAVANLLRNWLSEDWG